ncbi:Polysialic acid transport protein KpsD [Roseovarius sp. EC-HK134]|uniref:Polysialic acid transport protein KpsD n=1 Tax=Roseovarius mucosus TaxID=215743 RepID=A0A1V0RKD2_9RHOB|nr:polysialic acid transport protein KpsD [Roseovarius mucosus]VVT25911.1 Polysialic acid transport protein KpsD [Roseovarius sp. EC-HK134]VVT26079.1 Polysialic acid transport protein KpsD [Roseovarius sp. EC-SD190]
MPEGPGSRRVTRKIRVILGIMMFAALAACSLPRGAALQSEVLAEKDNKVPTFQVVEVTRRSTPALALWPASGWKGSYNWLSASRGPDSSIIQTGDRLAVVIWDNQENSLLASEASRSTPIEGLTVSSSGTVFMPYIGEVALRGMTESEARATLQTRLLEIAPSAQVQLTVEPGRNNAVDVVGGVAAPGNYPLLSRNTRILSVLASAGGIAPTMNNPLVILQRGGQVFETRAETLYAEPARNALVQGGDQIVVTEDDRTFNVLGAAGSQKVIPFEEERITAMEAVSAMGGLSAARADPKGLLVLREYEPQHINPDKPGPELRQVIFSLDFTNADGLFAARQFHINPGDTLLATESPVTRVQTILGLFGTVVGFASTANNVAN